MDDTDRAPPSHFCARTPRAGVSALAASLGVSRGTVQNRIARLRASGTIQGFTIRARADAAAAQVRAIMLIEVRGDRSAAVLRALRALPEVSVTHTTNGRWDLVVELAAATLPAFDAVLQRIRQIDGVANSETSLLLSST